MERPTRTSKTYVVPERIQAICARANPRAAAAPLGIGSLVLILWPGDIALHLLEEPSYRAAPRDDLRVRVVQRVAACGQTVRREALHARAEGDEPDAACVGVVQRKAGQDGVLAWLRGAGQRVVLGQSGSHDRIRHAACSNGTLLHSSCSCLCRCLARPSEAAWSRPPKRCAGFRVVLYSRGKFSRWSGKGPRGVIAAGTVHELSGLSGPRASGEGVGAR